MANIATDGNDVLTGGLDADTINGGAGEFIDGGSCRDHLDGGSVNDTLIYRLFDNMGTTDLYVGGSDFFKQEIPMYLVLNDAATTLVSEPKIPHLWRTCVLSICRSATKATYMSILDGIQYINTSDTPSAADLTVNVLVSDGTGGVTSNG